MIRYDDDVLKVTYRAWERPFKTRSNYARDNVEIVAKAACLGLVTTEIAGGFGDTWRATVRGLQVLQDQVML